MSSSDPVRRFLQAFAATLAVSLACILAAMLVIDPQGAGSGNALCPAGTKLASIPSNKSLIAWRTAPRTAILGTSRIGFGFDRAVLAGLGAEPSVNLGQPGGLPRDFLVLARDALAGGRLERAYIGVDFNMAFLPELDAPLAAITDHRWPRGEALRRSWLDPVAVRQLYGTLPGCGAKNDWSGAQIDASDHKPVTARRLHERMGKLAAIMRAGAARSGRSKYMAEREEDLETLLDALQQRGVSTVLFIPPSREEFMAGIASAGLNRQYAEWIRRMTVIADRHNLQLVNFQEQKELAALDIPRCPGGGTGCHFQDLTHFYPTMARAMAKRLGAAAQQGVGR